ncbi:MAG: Kdo hydroxylase family protein [Bryobacteraceae bacterium]
MKLAPVEAWPAPERMDYRPQLEAGNVVFFPATPFSLAEESKQFLRDLSFSGGAVHKNIAYRPATDRVTGIAAPDGQVERIRAIMRDYSRAAVQFTSELLPDYAKSWKLDYASFRPLEEEGRDLPLNKRNDLIHTDAFPSRPTYGNLILRVFTNISPSKARIWVTSDPFRAIAERYARDAGLEQIAGRASSTVGRIADHSTRALHKLGFPVVPRSAYDRFMLRFHDYLKHNADFQTNCAKYRFEFPPGSTWLTFTDILPHSVQSGRHALEQTFIIARESMANQEDAPVSILERVCRRPLT